MSLMSDFKRIEADIDAVVAIAKDVSGIVSSGKARFAAARDGLKAALDDAIASVESMAEKAKSTAASTEKVVEEATGEGAGPTVDFTSEGEAAVPVPVIDPSAGTTTHAATDGMVTTLDHEAGAETAKDGDGEPAAPTSGAAAAVVAVPGGLAPAPAAGAAPVV